MFDFNDRLFRTKCYHCGSTGKRLIHLMGSMNQEIGFILVCCQCGNYNRFVKSEKAIIDIVNHNYKFGKSECVLVNGKCQVSPCFHNKYLGDCEQINEKEGCCKDRNMNNQQPLCRSNKITDTQLLFKTVTDSVYGEFKKDNKLKEEGEK